MLIRRETPADVAAVHAVTSAAFARPGTAGEVTEARLLSELRACDAWLPALTLVAEGRGGEVLGHVVCTRGRVVAVPVLALGPLSVRPEDQRRGVGTALVHAVLGAADALGEPLVALLGSPAYYARFGFRPSAEYRITPPVPEWDAHFQVRALSAHDTGIHGTFAYPEPFDRV
ncbi:GNAT family N-acetyltransferase [Actinoallomurus iriomotensis]|uniref:N-acetyltransferase n=1 Tax=Actinoallomurus iriomotensis TaxID=478107 RepID=A0A9W6RDZ6_9ACTN|nr:N-acetyltransferase [Actinoallomurus iriomotensis]GLY74053.1 N-acetyltransferase [Actinoallomurus iriomotensis]